VTGKGDLSDGPDDGHMTFTEHYPAAGSQVSVVATASHWDLVVEGDLDLCSGQDRVGVATVLASYRVPVADIDLSGVGFVDPAGWHCVEDATRVLADAGTESEVHRPSEAVKRLGALFSEMGSSSFSEPASSSPATRR